MVDSSNRLFSAILRMNKNITTKYLNKNIAAVPIDMTRQNSTVSGFRSVNTSENPHTAPLAPNTSSTNLTKPV